MSYTEDSLRIIRTKMKEYESDPENNREFFDKIHSDIDDLMTEKVEDADLVYQIYMQIVQHFINNLDFIEEQMKHTEYFGDPDDEDDYFEDK